MFLKAINYKALQFLQTRVQVVFEYWTTLLFFQWDATLH